MARDGSRRASMVQAGARIHGPGPRRREVAVLVAWPALTLGAGQGSRLLLRLLSGEHQSSQGAGSRSGHHSGQPGGTVDALNAAPAATVAFLVASDASDAAPVAADAPFAAPVAPYHVPVAVVAPAAAPIDAHIMTLLSILCKASVPPAPGAAPGQAAASATVRATGQGRSAQPSAAPAQPGSGGGTGRQPGPRVHLHLDHALRACQRQMGQRQLGQRQAQPFTSRPPQHARQTPAQPQPSVHPSVQPQPQPSVQPSAQPQPSVQPSAQPQP